MKFSHIDNYYAFYKIRMVRCRQCHEYMVDESRLMHVLPHDIQVRECNNSFQVCDQCYKSSGFPVMCTLCGKHKISPTEFAYHTKKYLYEDSVDEYLICKACVEEKAQAVIRIMADADDIEKMGE